MANPTATAATAGDAPASLAPTPAVRAFFARVSDYFQAGLSQRRPWTELLDRSAFAKPESLAEATGRIRKNWTYFRVNYLLFVTAVVAVSLISNPVSLFILCGLLAAWIFLYLFRTEPLVLFGRSFSDREVLALMAVLTIVVVFLTEVGSLIISALVIGLGIVCAHGAFRVPDDLFLDEPAPTGGLLSFLGMPTTTQPPVASAV